MSKIDKLIQQYCPNGVEYVHLEDVVKIKNGKDYKHLKEGDIPVYGSGGIMTCVDTYAYDKPSVLLPRKGSIGNIFYVDTPFWTVDTCYYTEVYEDVIIPKFLYYVLTTKDLAKLNTASGAVPSLTQSVLYKLEIPLPPLPIQEEIVRILDTFTELEAELEARLLQYQHYRDQLFTFDDLKGIKWEKLGDVCELGTGSHNTQDGLKEGEYPFYTRGSEILYLNDYDYNETAIITAGDGAGVGKVFHFVQGKYALHQRAYRIVPDERIVLAKYIYYYMGATFYNYIMRSSVSSSVVSIRRPMMIDYPVPVPSLSEQERIVSILDKLYTLTHDLSKGLPAEIEARRQQYEYYRDKLLTFKQKN